MLLCVQNCFFGWKMTNFWETKCSKNYVFFLLLLNKCKNYQSVKTQCYCKNRFGPFKMQCYKNSEIAKNDMGLLKCSVTSKRKISHFWDQNFKNDIFFAKMFTKPRFLSFLRILDFYANLCEFGRIFVVFRETNGHLRKFLRFL